MYDKNSLAAAGSTGNNTHASVDIGGGYEAIAVQFVVEAAGATPTVTWKVQGTVDDHLDADDASAHWYDLAYITDASDTPATTALTSTAVGGKVIFAANTIARKYRRFRLVTSSNTNVTYHADLIRVSD